MARYQSTGSNSATENLSKVTDGIKTVFTSTLNDVKEINHVLREVVNSGDTLNPTGDPRISFDVDGFKQDIRDRLIVSDSFTQATRSVASYASNDRILKSIKEELSKNSHQKLKSYLDVIKQRLGTCRERLEEIQMEYSHIYSLAMKHKKRLIEDSRCVILTPATAGSSLVGLAGCFVAKHILVTIKSLFLSGDGDSSAPEAELASGPTPTKHQPVARLYMYDYLLCLLFGVAIGIGVFYLAKRFGFHQALGSGQTSFKEPGGVMLQSAVDSISIFLSKLQVATSRIRDLEQCLAMVEAIEYTLDKKNAEVIKSQLDKLQYETNVLLALME